MKKTKHLISVLVAVILVVTMSGINTFAENKGVTFVDVPVSHKYSSAIYTLVDEGILDGVLQYDNSFTFNPDSIVTRAEVCKMITATLTGNKASRFERRTTRFSDLSLDHWANPYITYTLDKNIVSGFDDGTFKPSNTATYGEVVKMLVCAKGYADSYRSTEPWYDGYIDIANDLKITQNVNSRGDKQVTKGQVAQMIFNFRIKKDIPKLYFEGNISQMYDKSDVRKVAVSYKDGDQSFSGYAKLKLQGASSMAFEKKNYTINFFSDSACSSKMKVDVGWGAQNKYCLKANWIDKTHARNIVTAQLASQVQGKYGLFENTPSNGLIDGFPIEIYSNGSFLGIYTFNIPKDEWMFGMNKSNPNHIVVCGDGWGPETLFTGTPNLTMWEVEVGPENDETLTKLNRMCQFVVNSSDEEFKNKFNQYLDLDSTLNYFIMTDVAFLNDNVGKNMILATYDGVKWYPSLYDLDTSWGASFTGTELQNYHNQLSSVTWSNLFSRVKKCFPNELGKRYFELRERIITKENILSKFKFFSSCIPQESINKEVKKWGANIPGYNIEQIEDYINSVLPRLDQKYINLLNK